MEREREREGHKQNMEIDKSAGGETQCKHLK